MLYISWRFMSQFFKIMANKLVYSWADKLWQMNPPRNYIATRYTLSPFDKNIDEYFR